MPSEFFERREDRAAVRLGGNFCAVAIEVENTRQFSVRGLMKDAQMMAPEGACADHCDARFVHVSRLTETRRSMRSDNKRSGKWTDREPSRCSDPGQFLEHANVIGVTHGMLNPDAAGTAP